LSHLLKNNPTQQHPRAITFCRQREDFGWNGDGDNHSDLVDALHRPVVSCDHPMRVEDVRLPGVDDTPPLRSCWQCKRRLPVMAFAIMQTGKGAFLRNAQGEFLRYGICRECAQKRREARRQ